MSYLTDAVQQAYSRKAKSSPDAASTKVAAQSVGYTVNDLDSIPAACQLGLGCGNPVDKANIKEGEIVVDLGSGAGIDVLLTALKVGPHGQVIGIDISPDMVDLARRNAKEKGLQPPQASFIHASLSEPLPISSDSVDCVLSNCVINLLPSGGKENILKEVHRVLKPGGRVILDDIVSKRQLPDDIRSDLTAYVNCISGAILIEDYRSMLESAGFKDSIFSETGNDLQAICSGVSGGCCATTQTKPTYNVNEWVASCQIIGRKAEQTQGVSPAPSVLLRWWDVYPQVQSSPAQISIEELETFMRGSPAPGKFAVIDVRRNDYEGGHVRGSENWHAQTFYDNLPTFFEKHKETEQVIFYCSSSSGRGPRYQDYLNKNEVTSSTAYVLRGGIKAWLGKYSDQSELVEV
ncbi:hypothetical protein H0H92_006313 [Tricholoma furcatifolium]|nr:hypothetical protein H0H92_006313 [Tricholoma furcatifolium]